MKKLLYILLLVIGLPAFSQGFLHQSGQAVVDGNNNNVLLRGVGLGGWMIQESYMLQTSGTQHEIRQRINNLIGDTATETFYQAYRDNGITKRDIDSLKAWGFNSVRLPMHYNLYTLPIEQEPVAGQQTWLDEGFNRTDQLLQWCAANQMYLILDMHATPGGQGKDTNISDADPSKPSLWESDANKAKMIALWHKLADRYKDSQWIGAYDIINEPNWNFTGTNQNGCDEGNNGPLRSLMVDITNSIRQVDTNHMIIIEGNCWGNNYNGIFPLWDNNMALSFHKYWNNNEQGSIQGMLDKRTQYNVPLWLGESGENSNVWFRDAIKLAETNNIGWSWWPVKKVESTSDLTDVTKSAGYQQLIDYWNGTGSAPSAASATTTLMNLANNYKMENTKVHFDVIDAMFRQVQTTATIPYKTHHLPGKVYATEYDLGPVGYAYNDTDLATYHSDGSAYVIWNKGYAMRNDGVDIQTGTDTSTNGFIVGYTAPTEWLQYTLTAPAATAYDIDVRYAGVGGTIHFEDENGRISQNITLTSTGSYTTFATATLSGIILKSGVNKIKLYIDAAGFNLNYIEFKNAVPAAQAAFKAIDAGTNVLGDNVVVTLNKSMQTGISFTNSALSLKVNGADVAISGFTTINDNTFSFIPATAVSQGDVVTLSYAGTNLVATDASAVAAFTNMAVANRVGAIKQIPGTIEAEDFYVNNGLTPETCTDAGGGQDLGYTDAGDSLDYLVNISQAGNFKVEYRTSGQNQTGQVKLQLISGSTTQDIHTVNLNSTGAWQTWATTSATAALPAGRYTMRVLITAAGFNFNWMRFSVLEQDDDNDGIANAADLCPDTPTGTVVDFTGCPLFTLPANNFTLLATNETCRTANNGSIAISAAANHNYVATITGTSLNQTANFTDTTTFNNLNAGAYQVCITLPEAPSYQQCFDFVITEPQDLAVLSKVAKEDNSVELELSGSDIYTIELNGQSFTTTQSTYTLNLNPGENTITVKAKQECQGTYQQKIILDASAVLYPNPVTEGIVNIIAPVSETKTMTVQVFNTLGELVLNRNYSTDNGSAVVDVNALAAGIYVVKIVSGSYITNTKIVKQ